MRAGDSERAREQPWARCALFDSGDRLDSANEDRMTSAYGAAGSLVLLLLWVNYSAQILFVGASGVKVGARRWERPLRPGPYAKYRRETASVVRPPRGVL